MRVKEFFKICKDVFRKPRYILSVIIIAFFFYLVNAFLINYQTIRSIYSLKGFSGVWDLVPDFFFGLHNVIPLKSIVTLTFIALSLGILFSLIFYKMKMIKSASGKTGFLPSTGIFLGVIAPGCATCGLGLLALFGFGSAVLSFFPYDGLELLILALGILFFAIYKATENINKGVVCEIK